MCLCSSLCYGVRIYMFATFLRVCSVRMHVRMHVYGFHLLL